MLIHLKKLVSHLCPIVAVTAALFASPAVAQPGFELSISSSEAVLESNGDPTVIHLESWDSPLVRVIERNSPFIELTNTSNDGSAITEFRMTIGDTLFNFGNSFLGDFAVLGVTTPGVQLTASTAMSGDELVLMFDNGGLAAGDVVRFRVDIDRDDPMSGFAYPDYRTVFFDLIDDGTADNSLTTATFDSNASLQQVLADQPNANALFVNAIRPYSTMEDVELFGAIVSGTVPEPTAIGLIGIGLTFVGRRRQR